MVKLFKLLKREITPKPIVFLTSLLLLCCLEDAIGQNSAARTGGAPAVPLQVGVGVVDVTPPVGYPIREGVSTGIKDPIYAKALVFKQGNVQGALLICNLLSIHRDLSRLVRKEASKETGIPYEHISITATHSHTAPLFVQPLQEYSDREAKGKLTDEDRNGYVAFIIKGMKDAIVTANKNAQAVAMKTGIGNAPGISFNRRYLMKDGRVVMNASGPDVVRPAGPIDPDVHFLMFRPLSSTNFSAALSVFASHYVRGGRDFSSDYPYFLEERLQETFGDQLVSVWGSGTCGDINTSDVMGRKEGRTVNSAAERVEVVGKTLADAIKKALPKTEQKTASLAVASKTIYLPLQGYSDMELKWAKSYPQDSTLLYTERPSLAKVRQTKILSLERIRKNEGIPPAVSGEPWMLPVEIQVFRLDVQNAIVTLPGELFVEHGLELKKHSPFANTMVIELANVGIHYVPTRLGFKQGDYEALNSRLAPGGGEIMVETAIEMLKSMKIQ